MATGSTVIMVVGIRASRAATAVETIATEADTSASEAMGMAAAREAGATSPSTQTSHLCMMAIRTLFRTHMGSNNKIKCIRRRAATANSSNRTAIRRTSMTRIVSRSKG